MPAVANKANPRSLKRRANVNASSLSSSATVKRTFPYCGTLMFEATKALYKAFGKVASEPITSPVDFISGPSSESTSGNFVNEKIGAFTWTISSAGTRPVSKPISANFSPNITRVASCANGIWVTFEMNGTVREARGFTSIT